MTQDKIKLNVLEKMKMLFPMSKEPIAITSAIELTCEECEEEITKLQEELKNKYLDFQLMKNQSKQSFENGFNIAKAEQTAKVEKLKEEINEKNLYNISKNNLKVIRGFIDKIFSKEQGGKCQAIINL